MECIRVYMQMLIPLLPYSPIPQFPNRTARTARVAVCGLPLRVCAAGRAAESREQGRGTLYLYPYIYTPIRIYLCPYTLTALYIYSYSHTPIPLLYPGQAGGG
jgi:hypothetical protein